MAIKLASSTLALSIKRLAGGTLTLLVIASTGRGYLCITIKKNCIQVVKLVGIIFTLSIKMLVKDILTQLLKAISQKMTIGQALTRL